MLTYENVTHGLNYAKGKSERYFANGVEYLVLYYIAILEKSIMYVK